MSRLLYRRSVPFGRNSTTFQQIYFDKIEISDSINGLPAGKTRRGNSSESLNQALNQARLVTEQFTISAGRGMTRAIENLELYQLSPSAKLITDRTENPFPYDLS